MSDEQRKERPSEIAVITAEVQKKFPTLIVSSTEMLPKNGKNNIKALRDAELKIQQDK
jgi:hypothetical protein